VYTETLTQRKNIQNGIPPQTINNATVTTTGIDMQASRRAYFCLYIGNVTGGGSISAKLRESNDNSSFTDLAGSNVSISAKTTTNKIETFEVRAGQLTKRYVQLSVTEGGSQNVLVSCTAEGDEGIHKPNQGAVTQGTQVDTQSVVA
jgi:hypothetical protein